MTFMLIWFGFLSALCLYVGLRRFLFLDEVVANIALQRGKQRKKELTKEEIDQLRSELQQTRFLWLIVGILFLGFFSAMSDVYHAAQIHP